MNKGTAVLGFIIAFVGGYFVGTLSGGGGDSGGSEELAAAADTTVERFRVPVGRSPQKGANDAKVTLIEYSDFECPFCSRVGPTLKALEKEFGKDIRFVFKNNPLPFHKNADLAAQAALAANEQGKFWEYHDKLFANQKALQRADLDKYAQGLGLDMTKFKEALDQSKFKRQVEADKRIAARLGARGTPAFFVNGRLLSGAKPKAEFAKVIKEEIAAADALIKAGTPAPRLYAAFMKDAKTSATAPDPSKRKPTARGGRAAEGTKYKVPLTGQEPSKGPKNAKVTIVEWSDFQ